MPTKSKPSEKDIKKLQAEIKLKSEPQYLYYKSRLAAIEEAIKYFLGAKELLAFDALYEKEFTRRILESKEH